MTVADRKGVASRPRLRSPRAIRRRGTKSAILQLPASSDPLAPRLTRYPAPIRTNGHAWRRTYLQRLVGLDLGVGVVAAVAATLIRFSDGADVPYALIGPSVPLLWILCLFLGNAYERRFLGQPGGDEYRAVGRALVIFLGLLVVTAFWAHFQLSRGYTLVTLPVLFGGGMLVRKFLRTGLLAERSSGRAMQRTVVVGRADAAAALIRSMNDDRSQGLQPVAVCASGLDGVWTKTTLIEGVPVLGLPGEAVSVVDTVEGDVVAVAAHPDLAGESLRRLAWALEERGVDLVVSPGLLDVAGPRMSIRPSTNLSLLHIERPTANRRSIILKQVLDRIAAALLLVVLSPVFIAITIAIKLSDPGPVFYRQERVGIRGELFCMFKFRTMIVGADKLVASLEDRNEGNGVLFKMSNDPRVTRVGRILRQYSLDELPQLINVVRGEMSLVGPRPPLGTEVEQYEPDAVRRLHVRPGMTGLWQVSGRSDLSWEESVRLDLRYVDNWSPMQDLQILFRTVSAVLARSGAY